MLAKKSLLNEINKEPTLTQGLKDWKKIKEKYLKIYATFKFVGKVNCFKTSAENAWLLYEFPSSLNPGDKPNVAQT